MDFAQTAVLDTATAIVIALALINLLLIYSLLSRSRKLEMESEAEKAELASLEKGQERLERALREEIANFRSETSEQGRLGRAEQNNSLKTFGDTMEKRLAETLGRVGEQMNVIQKNLGEMTQVATHVMDLKKVMTNITNRGAWGETRLEAILEDTLTSQQYIKNAQVSENSGERVEFAVLLPGGEGSESPLYLPVDSKFPMEDYQRLVQAQEDGDAHAAAAAAKAMEAAIKKQAKKIGEKYINPPLTADFALLFLPSEGLYLEALKRPGLQDLVRRENKVALVGPSTVTAFLLSLRMGFTTMAIQKRSREAWELLSMAAREFSRFGQRLEKTRERIVQADTSLDDVFTSLRQIERKLKKIEQAAAEGSAENEKDEKRE